MVVPGPGNCLGLIAAKTGPTAVRGQFYGTAAAVGKIGAFAGTWGMLRPLHARRSLLTSAYSLPCYDQGLWWFIQQEWQHWPLLGW